MKNLLFVLTAILFSLAAFGQKNKNKKNVPDFGKVEKADLELKECDFDKNAEAMVLFEVGELDCFTTNNVNLELTQHVRIKILQEKGRKNADIHLPFEKDEDVIDISAQTYNLDASGKIVVSKVDKKSVYEKKINKYYSEKVFTFPDVKEGSIIEYKYKLTGADLINWYFQWEIPVKYSEFTLDFPPDIEVKSSPRCTLPFNRKKENVGIRTVEFFSMENIPGFRDEQFMLSKYDYLERIETRVDAIVVNNQRIPLTTTWPKIVKNDLLDSEDFGMQLKKEIPRTNDLDQQLNKLTDPYQKMRTIHDYVRNNMTWNGYTGIWAFDGIKSAWKDKKGTAGEINLVLINLLKDAGLKAYPVLVSTHNHGLVNTLEPELNQFDKVLAYVVIGDKEYVLDATEKETPSYLIPEDVLLTKGLLIEKSDEYKWGWKTLWNGRNQYKNQIFILGFIDENGKMAGEVSVNSYDYARVKRAVVARKGVKDFTENFLSSSNTGINIDSVVFTNLETDSLPFIQKVYFNQPLSASGDYRYFSSNIFTGLEKNPFVADDRFSDVFFGANQYYSVTGTFYIPKGYAVEELPKNTKMIMPDTSISITRISQSYADYITVMYTLEFKKPFFQISEYPDFREFYKKLHALMNEQFVIRKKS